jgi:hypothetical protein
LPGPLQKASPLPHPKTGSHRFEVKSWKQANFSVQGVRKLTLIFPRLSFSWISNLNNWIKINLSCGIFLAFSSGQFASRRFDLTFFHSFDLIPGI